MDDFKLPSPSKKKAAPKDNFKDALDKIPLERQVELVRALLAQPDPPPKK